MSRDLRAEIRFKNAVLWNAMMDQFGREAEVARMVESGGRATLPLIRLVEAHSGVSRGMISGFLNLKAKPINKSSKPPGYKRNRNAVQLAEFLGMDFMELFPPQLYALTLPRMVVREFESATVLSLQEAAAELTTDPRLLRNDKDALKQAVQEALTHLTPKDREVITRRFGLDGDGEEYNREIAEDWGVTPVRIQQREQKALRHLRYSYHGAPLREFLG